MPNFKITPDIVLTVNEEADVPTGQESALTALLTVRSGKDHDLTLEDLRRLVEAGTRALEILEQKAQAQEIPQ